MPDTGGKQTLQQQATNKKKLSDLTSSNADLTRQVQENQYNGPGYQATAQGTQEKAAGVLPPGFRGITDQKTGQLLDMYKINPFEGAASQKLEQEALGTGPSDWAKNALEAEKADEAQQRGAAGLQAQTANSQAMDTLARVGGLGGGARTSLARSSARDALNSAQNVGAAGAARRYGITDTDTQRRQELLGQTADVERQADVANIGAMTGDLQNQAVYNANRYNQQMQAWAAKQSADATRAAGGGGGKK